MSSQIPSATRLKKKGIADVVFCIDSTGSMKPCIDGVKSHIQNFVHGFTADPQATIDLRVRLLSYRDMNYGEEIESFPFTKDPLEFGNQLARISASGGGDEPESTLDAIFQASSSEWRPSCTKIIVVFTDASPHKELHPASVQVDQPRDIDEVVNMLLANKVYLLIFAPEHDVYDQLTQQERSIYDPVSSGHGLAEVNFAKLMEFIGKTVSVEATRDYDQATG